MPEPAVPVTLAQAVLKSDKMDDVVRDAVMLGVVEVLPVVSARAETSLEALLRARRVERWKRIAVSSAKQCRRRRAERARPVTLTGLVEKTADLGIRLVLVEPSLPEGRSVDTLATSHVHQPPLCWSGQKGDGRPPNLICWLVPAFASCGLAREHFVRMRRPLQR